MEMAMSMLKALNIVALPKISKNDPTLQRRIKLLTQLEQQRELAANPNFIVLTQKWIKQDDGNKALVDKQKRVKKWWVIDMSGVCFFTVRYGSKLIEIEKGKAAITVGNKENLVSVIDAVIGAVKNGEFDTLLNSIERVGQRVGKKAA
jgi:hypothetical protein